MALSASELQESVEAILDRILETGESVEVEYKGRQLRLEPVEAGGRFDRMVRRDGVIVGDPDDLVHMDWSSEWNPGPFEP